LVLITSPDRSVGGVARLVIVGTQDAVRQQPEAAEVRKPRPLGEPGQAGQKQFWRHIGDSEVVADGLVQRIAGERAAESELQQIKRIRDNERSFQPARLLPDGATRYVGSPTGISR
jgi:hypothetical protein